MRILYGVQATGQGHISRARAMSQALAGLPVEVDWLFSGRPAEQLFDMEPFPGYRHRRGLTFATRAGGISYLGTLVHNNLPAFLRDVRSLDLRGYDAIVTDFEPVTAWAGRLAGVPTIGIGHQYAFGGATPVVGGNLVARLLMRHFAPVDLALGLHWHPYAANVLPPILDLPDLARERGEHVLVYLPFEDQDAVTAWLQHIPQQAFRQYAPGLDHAQRGNVQRCPTSIASFKRDLAGSRGVICNSGFELISECLHWHKPVLTRPLVGQMEQLSNAAALEQLGYARVTRTLCPDTLGDWLARPLAPPQLRFAPVHQTLARWVAGGCRETPAQLQRQLWPRDVLPGADSRPLPTRDCGPALGISGVLR